MSKKSKLILIFVLILVVIIGGFKYFSKNQESPYDWVLVKRGKIVQKISATGQVVPSKKINLQFEIGGKIEDVKVDVGDQVKSGQVLATLDDEELIIQLQEAEANQKAAQIKLNKLLAGASEEEIKIYETAVENAQIALDNAKISLKDSEKNLADVKASAENNLKQVYEEALNVLSDSYLKIYNAYSAVDLIQRTYFSGSDQQSLKVKESQQNIKNSMDMAKYYLDVAKSNQTYKNIDTSILKMEDALDNIFDDLGLIREICNDPNYYNTISNDSKTLLDTHRSYINGALSNIVKTQHLISSTKSTNNLNINAAQASFDSAQNAVKIAEGNLKSAQNNLNQIKTPPKKEDVELYKIQLDQAKAGVERIKSNLDKTELLAPCDGIITNVIKKEGESIKGMMSEPVLTLICSGPFQIEVDVPEVDIGKVDLKNSAEISLDAFPDKIFSGEIIRIDPAETVIQGVVYYKVSIEFNNSKEGSYSFISQNQNQNIKETNTNSNYCVGIKSGMTANVDIIIEVKENALSIPQRAILTKDDKKIVRVLEGKEIKEVEIETGIRGSEGEVEVLSGLKDGDKVITFIKQK